MIAKLIGERAKHAGRRFEARKARALVNYVIDLVPLEPGPWVDPRLVYVLDRAEISEPGEKCAAWGTRNIIAKEVTHIQAEMMALAACGRTKNSPIAHIVISWKEGEHPDCQQVEEAAATVMEVLGGADLQAIWAVHQNTKYRHVHIILNRVRRNDYSTCELGHGWPIDGLHQSTALIEARQGWAAEVGGMYIARANGEVRTRSTGKLIRSSDGQQLRRRGDRAEEGRNRREILPVAAFAATITATSESWPDLHKRFADEGYGYRPKGSGAVLFPLAGGADLKLSAAVAGASHAAMLARLGGFVAGSAQAKSDHEFAEYKRCLREANASVRAHRKAAWDLLDGARHRIEKEMLLDLNDEVSALLEALITDEFARIRLQLGRQYDELLQKLALSRIANGIDWAAKGQPDIPGLPLPVILCGAGEGVPTTPPGYIRHEHGLFNTYTRPDRPTPAITDFRSLIVITGDNEDVLAGLRMACVRWGRVEIVADAETCRTIEALARENRLDVVIRAPAAAPLADQHRGLLNAPIATSTSTPVPENNGITPVSTRPVVPSEMLNPSPVTSTKEAENAVQGPRQAASEASRQRVADPFRLAYFAKLAEQIAARVGARVLGLSTVGLVSAVRWPAHGPRFLGAERSSADVLLPSAAHDHLGQGSAAADGMRHPGASPAGTRNRGREERAPVAPLVTTEPAFELIRGELLAPLAPAPKPPQSGPRIDTDKRWDEAIKLIIAESIYLIELPSPDGSIRFDAPSLSTGDRALLSADRYASRTEVRLKERFKHQKLEITRVVRWLAAVEKDEAKYPTINGRLSIANTPPHLQTLIARYHDDRDIDAARTGVATRRNERALQRPAAPDKQTRAAELPGAAKPRLPTMDELLTAGLENRQREARARYPDAKIAETNEVRALINALRDAVAEEKLEAAADRVALSPEASADVMRHGPDLATAYHRFAADTLARQAAKARSARQDFGR